MSDRNCRECGGHGGSHYNDCSYDGVGGGTSSGSGIFVVWAFILGFVGTAGILSVIGVDADKVPSIVLIILLLIVTSVAYVVIGLITDR